MDEILKEYSSKFSDLTENGRFKFIKKHRTNGKAYVDSYPFSYYKHRVDECSDCEIIILNDGDSFKIKETNYTGASTCIVYLKDMDTIHNDCGPARIITDLKSNQISSVEWFKDGIPHRDEKEGPQFVSLYGKKMFEKHFVTNGKLHRTDGPALSRFLLSYLEQKDSEYWYNNGVLYKKIYYDTFGDLRQIFYVNPAGEYHRLDGPAIYDIKNSYKTIRTWRVNGKNIDPSILPVIENEKILNNKTIDRAMIVEAFLFDRDYGNFLLKFKEK